MQPFIKSRFWGILMKISCVVSLSSLTRPEAQVVDAVYAPAGKDTKDLCIITRKTVH